MSEYTMEDDLREFIEGYISAALWSETDPNGVPLDENYTRQDIAPETLACMKSDCEEFFLDNRDAILCGGGSFSTGNTYRFSAAGRDFWFTRCGHGAGFWDGDWPEPYDQILTRAANFYGHYDLYIGEDGKIRD